MSKKIVIDPITRLEGHGKINIFLNKKGNVEKAIFQVPELRGFEKFCEGRLAEELARITPKICGVCPTAHHMASGKALDNLFSVEPPPAAKKIRELINSAFIFEDHVLHFFYLGGPDFIVGPTAPKAERNILGVLGKVGLDIGKKVIEIRKKVREVITRQGGRVIHPVNNLPGGVSKGISKEDRKEYIKLADEMVEFAQFTLKIFSDIVLKNKDYVDLIVGDIYKHKTYYMGLVDENNQSNLYDGDIRVVTPEGKEFVKFKPSDYLKHIKEHVEPWSYIKFPYLKDIGWKGFTDGEESGIYRVAPLARLNVSEGMATPLAHEEYEKMFETLGGKPAHNTLAYHWARLVEVMYAAERFKELANDEEILDNNIRNIPTEKPKDGVGVVEAPRGTLFHHYKTDERGRITNVNLIVATLGNSAAMCLSIEKAAKNLIKNGKVNDGLLNMVEMAFRAYDPCLACATHSLPGEMPLSVNIFDKDKNLIKNLKRD
ncbi:MAG: Ni/Fe hydrogenase subunit alpha [Candidatus Marinimicrobia bacterium]|jgi:F420-non-reducing hydrogenase large subunit|nr:Ni/Fe hydrogenase subunit alpha [Candidatus Neomarinimicrobiota bacterium]